MTNLSLYSVEKDTKISNVFISENLEIISIAIAKTFSEEIVNESHLLIACCEFLCKHEPSKCSTLIKNAAEQSRKSESSRNSSGFNPPTIPLRLLEKMKQCSSADQVVALAESISAEKIGEDDSSPTQKPAQLVSMGDFHEPLGPFVGVIPRLIPNKDFAAKLVQPFLLKDEFYSWDGPYNTKDRILVTRPGQSMGRMFVTNKRLLFWSDDVHKPHVGLFYADIQGWKTSWMPMKSRGVIVIVAGRKVIFAANSSAIENAERFINAKG
jgi:hypothetical protein